MEMNVRYIMVMILGFCIVNCEMHAINNVTPDDGKGQGKTKSLVIGISHYLDPDIPDMQLPHRDAELFAGFLRSQTGHDLNDDNLKLLTNNNATAAQVASSMDWLIDGMDSNDTCVLYFSGYGYEYGQKQLLPSKLYFYDTPLNVHNAGAYDVFNQFVTIAGRRKINFKLFANLYPLILTPELHGAYQEQNSQKPDFKKPKNMIVLNTIELRTSVLA